MTSMDVDSAAAFNTAAGPGAGAFLLYPIEPECQLEAPLWATAARRRVGLQQPAASNSELDSLRVTCQNNKREWAGLWRTRRRQG